jgi:hypothetical protein
MGLFVSWNGGAAWSRLNAKNLPNVAVHDILIHPRENDLILGTHGRSILILDDIAVLQQPPSSEIKLYTPRLTYRFASRGGGGGGGLDEGGSKVFKGTNPRYGVPITFSHATKITPKVEIVDAAGKVIRELTQIPKEPGVQRVVWDLRHEGPKVRRAPTAEEAESPFTARGPKAVPGVYTVRLTVGSTKLEEKMEVRLDPALKATQEDLASQLSYGLKLRDMQSNVNTTLRAIDQLKDLLKGIAARGKTEAPIAEWQKALDKETLRIGLPSTANRLEDAPGLIERLTNLGGIIDGPNAAPLPQQVAHFAEVEKEYNDNLPAVKASLRKSVAEWNQTLAKLNLGTLPVPQ